MYKMHGAENKMASAKLGALALTIALLLVTIEESSAGKILIMSMQYGSHLNEFAAIAKSLVKIGHTVHVTADENLPNPSQFKGVNVEFLYYKSPNKELMDKKKFDEKMANAVLIHGTDKFTLATNLVRPRFTYDCKMLLHDDELVKRLERESYDIALADLFIPCYHLLAHKLDVPVVTVGAAAYSLYVKTHPLASFVSTCNLTPKTNTFVNRVKTLLNTIFFESFVLPTIFVEEVEFKNYVPERPHGSLQELVKRSKLFILNKNGVIDCPSPTMPNLIQVGGLTTTPPQPLKPDYQLYVNEAKNGFIVVSFGSGIAYLPKDKFMKFLNAFKQLKQRVIWRGTKTYGERIPENVKIVQWLPQNDLLAHPNAKLFITHCGGNGQAEAIHHGVPMLGFPLFAEQDYNMERVVHKGFALGMDINDYTSEEMVRKINELINNPKYSIAIKKASKILKSLPDPRDTAAFWIDHVMQHGADHLTTTLSDLNYVQFFMIDIFLFVFAFVLVVWFVLKKFLFYFVGRLWRGASKTKQKKV